ncbi:sterigmatocystin biosynthesis monooxygenase STCB [Fusarium acutatum]|uniref:Sterigmatocystin biosynthesis monooxygenase STCB n=1 Tax=Fusarium acutatum TaxID=78861 RepID=A0A8H4J8W9_9HYPO|nr:sterigmatocystin biosynthesis monooxygenase STCB [Fusarium acutatum]
MGNLRALINESEILGSRGNTLTGGIFALVVGFAVYSVYQLFLHPLRQLPGPLWARMSSTYLRWTEIHKDRAPKRLLKLHRQYGPVVRVGPNEVSISDPTAYRDIYTNRANLKEARFYTPFKFLGLGNVFASVDPSDHAARRKIMSIPFSHQQVISNEQLIAERVETFIQRILERARASHTGTVEVYELCGLLSLEVICRLSFNYDFTQDPEASHTLLKALEGSALAMILNTIFPFLRAASFGTKLPGVVGHAYQSFKIWEKMTGDMLASLRDQEIDAAAMKSFAAAPLLLQTNKEMGRTYTFAEATEEAMGIAVAGSGVTEHTMIYFMYALSRPENRHVQDRLRKEVLSTGTSFAEVSVLPYLTAVMKEIYRLYPAIMSTLPRILASPLDIKSQNVVLPPGTVVGMQNYVHHRDPQLFPSPDRLIPERWLEDEKSSYKSDLKAMDSAVTPFSLGSRNCVGQTLAKVQLYLAFSQLLRRVDFSLNNCMKDDDMAMLDLWAVSPKAKKLVLDIKVD